jgi:hypothetical protein
VANGAPKDITLMESVPIKSMVAGEAEVKGVLRWWESDS